MAIMACTHQAMRHMHLAHVHEPSFALPAVCHDRTWNLTMTPTFSCVSMRVTVLTANWSAEERARWPEGAPACQVSGSTSTGECVGLCDVWWVEQQYASTP